ncbi:ribonuclease HII, partial [Bacillus cereus group sp. N18]|nr:ribonuclease HII [Bacillus cereus group sp. N18]
MQKMTLEVGEILLQEFISDEDDRFVMLIKDE